MRSQCGPSQPCQPVARPDWIHNHSTCGCVDASASHSHCPLAPADVAALDVYGHHRAACSRVEVIVDGLTLWHGAQLVVDTTLVMVRRVGTQQPRVVWLSATHAEREDIPGTHRRGRRARLVVLVAEVGGRWSKETESPQLLQNRVTAAYISWSALLACIARSFTLSLLEQRPVSNVGADVPSEHEVLREARFV